MDTRPPETIVTAANQNTPYAITDLSELVKKNNLAAIKITIQKEKESKGRAWQYLENKDIIAHAVRDAILLGQLDTVRFFLDQGFKPSESIEIDIGEQRYRRSFIHFAVASGNLAMVQLLVEAGADIKPHNSYYDKGNDDGIRAAIKSGRADIVEYLLSKGANADGGFGNLSHRDTFYGHAAKHDRHEIIELLIRYGGIQGIEYALARAVEKYVKVIEHLPYQLEHKYCQKEREEIVKRISSAEESLQSFFENEVNKFDEEKAKVTQKLKKYKSNYEKIIRNLLDHAFGCDFSPDKHHGLGFLRHLKSIAGVNFCGVSVGGQPVTRDMLAAENVVGIKEAIITLEDLNNVTDAARLQALTTRVVTATKEHGLLLRNDGVLNLVPLWRAAEIGDLDAVKARLSAGVNPNGTTDASPILLAAKNNHEDIINLLVNHASFDLATLVAAIETAQDAGHAELAEKLKAKQDVNQLDPEGNSLLHHAVANGNVEEVRKLLTKHADPNLKGSNGYPLEIAALRSYKKEIPIGPSKKHIEILRLLLDSGANPNLFKYHSAMYLAARAGSFDALALLLPVTNKQDIIKSKDDGTNENETFPWYTDVMFDSYGSKEWLAILRLLKTYNVDFNQTSVYGGYTLLHLVLRGFPSRSSDYSSMNGEEISNKIRDSVREFNKHMQLLDYLLANNADPTIRDPEGRTAVHSLYNVNLRDIIGGYAKIIDRCLKNNFHIDTPDKDGRTLLHYLANHGQYTGVKYLLARGANINAVDHEGRTPLYYAACGKLTDSIPYPSPSTTEYLLQHGASTYIKDINGETPLSYATAACNKWLATSTYESWYQEKQNYWRELFNQAKSYLENGVTPLPKKPASVARYTNSTQFYIRRADKTTLQSVLANLQLDDEDSDLLPFYCDDFTHQLIETPVLLYERVYDLKTLLAILCNDKKDPFTGRAFNLSDIIPDYEMEFEMGRMKMYIKKKYKSTSKPKPADESALMTHGTFAISKKLKIDDDNEQIVATKVAQKDAKCSVT